MRFDLAYARLEHTRGNPFDTDFAPWRLVRPDAAGETLHHDVHAAISVCYREGYVLDISRFSSDSPQGLTLRAFLDEVHDPWRRWRRLMAEAV